MPLPIPNLDDRSFDQLVSAAIDYIKHDLNTDWSDLSAGDPGVVLLEAFAYLTEQLIYRLNRLPRKVYIAYLRLLGVTIMPATAARVQLSFWRASPGSEDYVLPRGSLVTIADSGGQSERPVFATIQELTIPKDSASVESATQVLAYHCELIEEALAASSGSPGQAYTVRWPPVIAPTGQEFLDLKVGVQVEDGANEPGDWLGADKRYYRLWQEVDNFYGLTASSQVYMVDRQAGLIQFAPAARPAEIPLGLLSKEDSDAYKNQPLAAVPPAGKAIRVWYAHGGGEAGNVPAGKLTSLLSVAGGGSAPALNVINREPARGGFEAETLENALVRGPQSIFALRRTVTPREFEAAALNTPTAYAARARAIAAADLWKHAVPGTVDLVLVPRLNTGQPVTARALAENQGLANLDGLLQNLELRSPLGIRTHLRWARYKRVRVAANISFNSNEKPEDFQSRITQQLNRLISPLPGDAGQPGWRFGQPLRVADIYNAILAAETSSHPLITSLTLLVEHAPDSEIRSLAADFFQPGTWYAASGSRLFRSTNDGAGWELVLNNQPGSEQPVMRFGDRWLAAGFDQPETVRHVRPNPARAGLLAVTSQYTTSGGIQSPLYLSLDCGENWFQLSIFQDAEIEDIAWLQRADQQVLLLATSRGLLEANLIFGEDGQPILIEAKTVPVEADRPDLPVYAVTVLRGSWGSRRVAVALRSRGGVYLSAGSNLKKKEQVSAESSFSLLGLRGEDVRHLNVQSADDRLYLWAGAMALADYGKGAYRWQFDQETTQLDNGKWISSQWTGGSCLALAFEGQRVFAVSAWGGMLLADLNPAGTDDLPVWQIFANEELPHRPVQLEEAQEPDPSLPQQDEAKARRGLFKPIYAVATNASAGQRLRPLVLLGASDGVYGSLDLGVTFNNLARRRLNNLRDAVTLPPDWLFLSSNHLVTATYDSSLGRQSDTGEV